MFIKIIFESTKITLNHLKFLAIFLYIYKFLQILFFSQSSLFFILLDKCIVQNHIQSIHKRMLYNYSTCVSKHTKIISQTTSHYPTLRRCFYNQVQIMSVEKTLTIQSFKLILVVVVKPHGTRLLFYHACVILI